MQALSRRLFLSNFLELAIWAHAQRVHELVLFAITGDRADLIIQTKESRGTLRCILHLGFYQGAPHYREPQALSPFKEIGTKGPPLLTFRPATDFGFHLSVGRRPRFRDMVVDLGLSTVVFPYY